MSQWYLLRDNQTHGPYEEAQVREWVQAGQIGPADRLCPVGGTDWRPVGEFLEFAAPSAAPPSTGYAAPAGGYPAVSTQPLGPTTASGLSAWINTGWQMVSTEWGAFVGAMLLMLLVTIVSIGICGPPLGLASTGCCSNAMPDNRCKRAIYSRASATSGWPGVTRC